MAINFASCRNKMGLRVRPGVTIFFLIVAVASSSFKHQHTHAFILNNEPRSTSMTSTSFISAKVFSDMEGFMQFPDDQIMTSNPCLTHYCAKGRECWVNNTGHPECVCQRTCPYRKKPICGTDGIVYENHCELHRAACMLNRPIAFQKIKDCSTVPRTTTAPPPTTTTPTTTTTIPPHTAPPPPLYRHAVPGVDLLDTDEMSLNEIPDETPRKGYCSSQEYEIMKDNLLLYSHTRLMTQDNNHSKDFLVSIMFSHYDQNNNGLLEEEELRKVTKSEHLDVLSNGCGLNDMLVFDDGNNDRVLNINEFYQAFNKMYSLSVVSLDKALETNHLSARVGDNVEIKCDVSGSPVPPILWQRYSVDLTALNEDGVRILGDGSLYLTNIQLSNAGNYSCHAQRNKDVMQTHILSVHNMPTVRVQPTMQSRRPQELCELSCHITGEPFPDVQWLKNDVALDSSNSRFEIIGNGSRLRIHNLTYSDTGAYVCQASNVGGVVQEISSLIVQDEPVPTVLPVDHLLFIFHDHGISIHDPSACGIHHRIHSSDLIPGTGDPLCGKESSVCYWGRSIVVASHLIFVSQPTLNRVLVISTMQMIVVEIVATDRYPVELYQVPHLDQVWILNWRSHYNTASKSVQVIRNASNGKHRHSLHTDSIEGQFDSVKGLFVPQSDQIEQVASSSFRYGYVTHENQRGMYKLDLENQRYTKSIDLTLYNCVPEVVIFVALYGYVIVSCREPVTGRPTGQLLMDYLTDSVLSTKPAMIGIPAISPDSRLVTTIDHRSDGVTLALQKVTAHGLEFSFDVKTTLNISATTFYESQSVNGYDLFATAINMDDVLYLNLFSGKVEIITDVGTATRHPTNTWSNPRRQIVSTGIFGKYLATPANQTVYVLRGIDRTIHCQIDGLSNPTEVTWIDPATTSQQHSNSRQFIISNDG